MIYGLLWLMLDGLWFVVYGSWLIACGLLWLIKV
jgi:hypothetical protein